MLPKRTHGNMLNIQVNSRGHCKSIFNLNILHTVCLRLSNWKILSAPLQTQNLFNI